MLLLLSDSDKNKTDVDWYSCHLLFDDNGYSGNYHRDKPLSFQSQLSFQ